MIWIITTVLLILLSLVLLIINHQQSEDIKALEYALLILAEDKMNGDD